MSEQTISALREVVSKGYVRPTDDQAEILRLADQRDELLAALEDLHGQVRHFCETQGEADFETGRAVAAIAKVKGGAA